MNIDKRLFSIYTNSKKYFWITMVSCLLAITLQTTEASGEPDRFEPNDTPENANLIIIESSDKIDPDGSNYEPPTFRNFRNFHSNIDMDWVVFLAQKNKSYTISVEPVDTNTDILPDYTLFFLNGNQLEKVCEPIKGGVSNDVDCPIFGKDFNPIKEGFYFIKLENSNPEVTDAGTSYAIRIGGQFGDHILGIVRDANTGEPIVGATITIEGSNFSPIQSQGSPLKGLYSQLLPPLNSLILVATLDGYVEFRTEVTDTSVQVDIDMVPNQPDRFEPNNTSEKANLIFIGSDERPLRNFHSETDIDWVVFFAQADESYTIDVSPVNNNADLLPDYTLFFLNGNQLDQVCETISGGDSDQSDCPVSGSEFNPSKQGFYFIKLENSNPEVTGDLTTYSISIPGALTGEIQGTVRDAITGEPIMDAIIAIEGTSITFQSTIAGHYILGFPVFSSFILVATHDDFIEFRTEKDTDTTEPLEPVDIDMVPEATEIPEEGYLVTDELWIRAVIETEDKGPIEGVWQLGGQDMTARGDQVVWGHFYASPSDVSWGSQNNPDLFVKIWIDVNGPIYVDYFHVSVPDIHVHTDFQFDGTVDQQGTATLTNRFVEHRQVNGTTGSTIQFEDGFSPAGFSAAGNPQGTGLINNLRIGSIINTVDKGPIEGVWRLGGQDTTARGDQVVWGYFYADPNVVSWGSQNNPDLFVKIWFDVGGAVFVDFFHVSVPDIEVFSNLSPSAGFANSGVTILSNRFVEHR